MTKQLNVSLIGNPNTGKTSLFNTLTGLNQQTGNYPGVTVEKKKGTFNIAQDLNVALLDLPGTYSLYASSIDEYITTAHLITYEKSEYPDVLMVVCDVNNLKKNLLLYTQAKDLGIPTILVINMVDQMDKNGISLNVEEMERVLHTKIVLVSSKKRKGIDALKDAIRSFESLSKSPCLDALNLKNTHKDIQKEFPNTSSLHRIWLKELQLIHFDSVKENDQMLINKLGIKTITDLKRIHHRETVKRYQFINDLLKRILTIDQHAATSIQSRLDRIFLHKFWGYFVFFFIMVLIFQSIYSWATYPMDFIDWMITEASALIQEIFPPGLLVDLIANGIIPGLGGVVIFIPQIAFLFLFIALLEESGYMSRVVFLMDKLLRPFGLSGKSVVPFISGMACAIPAVMATRNIENWKERLITILVVPFTTCSARLPVYLMIISLVIPDKKIFGILGYQSLVLTGLYLLGFIAAIISAWILHKKMRIKNKSSHFIMEMPVYRVPIFKNVLLTMINKTKAFVMGAGKIILAISILLWALASFGPGDKFYNAEEIITTKFKNSNKAHFEQELASYKLEHSFIGYLGKVIEPVVAPLGYDWKIGIGVISSFAAREVFVGTLATIYSIGDANENTIKEKLASARNPKTGAPILNLASGLSLIMFYVFAMQCMSTLAIVKRETATWKWPMIQFATMSLLAYGLAFLTYQIIMIL